MDEDSEPTEIERNLMNKFEMLAANVRDLVWDNKHMEEQATAVAPLWRT